MLKSTKVKLILLLIGLTFFAYISSLGNPFIWDDDEFITNNIYVQHFQVPEIFTKNTIAGAGLKSNYYRPITSLSFAIDAQLWGKNSFPFHLVNLGLHISSGVLLFLLLGMLGMSNLPAFFISLFFLIFPTQVETVSYINSRGDGMFAFLFLASLVSMLWAFRKNRQRFLWLSAVLFVLSILGKETALFGLPLFGGVVWLYAHKMKVSWKRFLNKGFFVGLASIAGFYFLLRMTVFNFKDTLNFYSTPDIYSTNLFVRLFTFCKILFVYLGLLVWPYPLHMERSVSYVTTLFSWWVLGAFFLISGVGALAVFAYKKYKNPWILFGLLWSGIFLIPVSGIIPINGLLYEHWLYMPLIGVLLIGYGVFLLVSRTFSLAQRQKTKKILISFGIVLAILYMILTIRQNNIWSDPVGFYRYTLQFSPNSVRLHTNLGISLSAAGDNQGAIAEYKKALAIEPSNPQAYNDLGYSYLLLGQYDLAEKTLLYTLKLYPTFLLPRTNLVKVYLLTKQYDKARAISGNNPMVEQLIQELQHQSAN